MNTDKKQILIDEIADHIDDIESSFEWGCNYKYMIAEYLVKKGMGIISAKK